jgi:hypothetical protein
VPGHALSGQERTRVLEVANEPRFAAVPPARIATYDTHRHRRVPSLVLGHDLPASDGEARLSIGDWRYADKGLLDKTHIRFFTRQTTIEMLQGAGFEITELIPHHIHHPTVDKFLDIIENLAATTGGDRQTARVEASVFQYIVKAQ